MIGLFSTLYEIVSLAFWYSCFAVMVLGVKLLLIIVPNFVVKAEVVRVFEQYRVKVTMANDEQIGKYDQTKFRCEVVVNDERFWKCVAFDDSIGLGEGYMVS